MVSLSYSEQKISLSNKKRTTNQLNVPENVPEKRRINLLNILEKNPEISISDLALSLKVSDKTIKRDIIKLKEENYIKRIGPNNGGQWKVIRKIE